MAGRGGYRKRKRRSLSRLYFLMALVFALAMFKWGFSGLIKVISETGGGDTKIIDLNDVVAPQTPVISALPEATNSAQIKIEGYTEAEVEVGYLVNNRKVISEQADEKGFYKAILDLEDGENLIQVTARDQAGNESISKLVKVIYDFEAPEIKVAFPTERQEFFGVQKQNIAVYGEVSEADADLRINNTFVSLDSNGLFDQQVRLNEGENEIKLVATDLAGNQAEETIKVSYVR